MKIRAYFLIASLLLIFCVVLNANSQIDRSQASVNQVADAQAAISRLRELYNRRDFESGYEIGQKLVGQFPGNAELRAWFIVNMARNEMGREAIESAKELVGNDKENAWAWFALAHAYIRSAQIKEAIPAAETALKLMPDNEEFIFLYASSLLAQKKYDEIYAWLDKNSFEIKDKSRFLYVKAEAEYRQFLDGKVDEAKRKQSFEDFQKALNLNPNSVNANYIFGVYLSADRRFDEALPILKKTVSLAPQSAQIRQTYWTALLNGQPKKTQQQKNDEVVADTKDLLRLRPDSANAFDAVSAFYGRELEMPDKKKEIDEIIIKKFPQTTQAERILIGQIREFNYLGEDGKVDGKKKSQLTGMLEDFINRPRHFSESNLGYAYTQYFYQIQTDKNASNRQLLQTAENISEHQKFETAEVHSMIVSGLSDRQMFREAEKFANTGFEKVKEEIEQKQADGESERRIREDENSMNATLYNARGELFFKENLLDKAETDFMQAVKLDNENTFYYSNLAKIYEAENNIDKAEDAYINAFSTFFGNDNPNFDKLKTLYQKRNGNLQGFDDYFEKVKVTERARRKERILSAKIEDSQAAIPFTLKNLDEKTVSLADYKGKIIVLNIWGTWCAPCVREMPELQTLYKKYQKDKDVAILTIDSDDDLKKVKKFMADNKYNFTVLQNGNYLETTDINAFPTTWFINREGRIEFVKVGTSVKLLEEFGWRIEELKNRH